jgi:hypothetical protein
MAIRPSAITKITATGVAQARILVWSEVAPVRNGEAWANADAGTKVDKTIRRHCNSAAHRSIEYRMTSPLPLLQAWIRPWGYRTIRGEFRGGEVSNKNVQIPHQPRRLFASLGWPTSAVDGSVVQWG